MYRTIVLLSRQSTPGAYILRLPMSMGKGILLLYFYNVKVIEMAIFQLDIIALIMFRILHKLRLTTLHDMCHNPAIYNFLNIILYFPFAIVSEIFIRVFKLILLLSASCNLKIPTLSLHTANGNKSGTRLTAW